MEPYNEICALVEARITAAMGRRPEGLVVAPCRTMGYHLYSNAGFLARGPLALEKVCPPQCTVIAQGGFINYRLSAAALRLAVEQLAGQAPVGGHAAAQPARASRLEALLALRADEKAWGPEGEALAWLLIVSRPPVGKREMERLWRAFEAYFRCGRVDHQLIQALRLRLAQAHEEGEG